MGDQAFWVLRCQAHLVAVVRRRARRRQVFRCGERASVTLLVPVGVLVLVVMGAIAVDLTLIGSSQHSMRYAAATAADDAAAQIDEQAIRSSGQVVIDMERAAEVARVSISAADLPGEPVGSPQVSLINNGSAVQVTAAIRVPHIFGRAIPGVDDFVTIEATASATIEVR